jgi:ATP-binding cassette subfamily F protein 3
MYEKQQKQIAHLQKFINRFKAKASKARQAQSRVKAIERMELVSAVHMDSPFHFTFREPGKCANPMLSLTHARVAYGEKTVLNDVTLSLTPEDRIALIGPNGAGKSSLIKLLAGEISVAGGLRETSAGLKIGYFAQHQIDHLQLSESPLDHLRNLSPQSREQELRSFLGSFGFSNNRVHETVGIFSGGEKSRLALALLIWQKPNLLLLDEPTNHLDLEMRHALSMALQEYLGAMILVSHDRFLVRSTVDNLILVAHSEIKPFDGDLNDYERWLSDFRKQTDQSPPEVVVSRKSQRQLDAAQRELRRPLVQNMKKCEAELETLQKKAASLEKILANTSLYEEKNKMELQNHLQTQAVLQKQIKTAEDAWLKACDELSIHDNQKPE